MLNLISTYQRELNKVTEKLSNDKDIVACFVLGSMVNGDIWKGSDIDLIVVEKNAKESIYEVYATEGGVPIQAKFIDYEEFLLQKKDIANKLKNSRVIFCKDDIVIQNYHKLRYNFDEDL